MRGSGEESVQLESRGEGDEVLNHSPLSHLALVQIYDGHIFQVSVSGLQRPATGFQCELMTLVTSTMALAHPSSTVAVHQ